MRVNSYFLIEAYFNLKILVLEIGLILIRLSRNERLSRNIDLRIVIVEYGVLCRRISRILNACKIVFRAKVA